MKPLAVLLTVTLLAACTGPSVGDPPIIRLVDLVGPESVVESPLLELPPDDEVLASVAEAVVFRDDFEHGEPADYRWSPWPRRPHFRPLEGGGRAWCRNDASDPPAAILLPARPRRRYRVTRTLVPGADGPDLQVVERTRELSDRFPFNPPDAVAELGRSRLRDLLTIHHFPAAGPLDFSTTPATASLMILFDRDGPGVRDPHARSCVDALEVVRLETTPEQELAFARDAHPGPGSAGDSGFVKRGQLLPVPAFEDAVPPLDHNLDHRDALFAPTPTIFRFGLTVPEAARLSFSYALAGSAEPGDEAVFRVTLTDRGELTRLFEERVAVGEGEGLWPWREADLDLSPWSGREIVLTMTTRGPENGTPVHALWGGPTVDRPRRAGEPPNVLLVGLDTLRADRVSAYGYERSTTPNLDALAAEGVRFDQAVSAAPWTAPSFASIFTGLMPSAHGVVNRLTTLSGELTTVTERFRRAGWRTQGYAFKPFLFNLGFEQGFDDWFNVPRLDRTARDSVAKALGFLDRHGDRRFFLFLHFDDPHEPLRQPPPWDTKFVDAAAVTRFGLELPANIGLRPGRGCAICRDADGVTPEYRRTAGALYDGAVSFMDDRLGHLFAELKRRGLWDDTVVAVVSDHGETLWDRADRFGHGNSLAEELVRAVLIVKPRHGRGLGGRVVEEQVRLTDLAPTLLDLAGLEVGPAQPDSRTLVPMMRGARHEGADFAFSENPRTGMLGVRHGPWKYVTNHWPGRRPRERLHDLRTDPHELRDEMQRHPEVLPRLRRELAEQVLRNRGGLYLMAIGDAEPALWRLELTGGAAAPRTMSFFGLTPQTAGAAAAWEHEQGPPLALVEVAVPAGGEAWRALLRRRGDTASWGVRPADGALEARPGMLETLGRRGPGLYLVASAAGIEAPLASAESADNLERLRALGYVE